MKRQKKKATTSIIQNTNKIMEESNKMSRKFKPMKLQILDDEDKIVGTINLSLSVIKDLNLLIRTNNYNAESVALIDEIMSHIEYE